MRTAKELYARPKKGVVIRVRMEDTPGWMWALAIDGVEVLVSASSYLRSHNASTAGCSFVEHINGKELTVIEDKYEESYCDEWGYKNNIVLFEIDPLGRNWGYFARFFLVGPMACDAITVGFYKEAADLKKHLAPVLDHYLTIEAIETSNPHSLRQIDVVGEDGQ